MFLFKNDELRRFIIVSLIILCWAGCDSTGAWKRSVVLSTRTPDASTIKISNDSDIGLSFTIALNDQAFFNTVDEVMAQINQMSDADSDESTARKVWRFTVAALHHEFPLSQETWYHNPALFFNSLGFGYCDDASAMNYHLWKSFGYEARMWNLSGHVVPEVFREGRWEMYDADMQLYYYTSALQIAGVEELADDPELITSPVQPLLDSADEAYSSVWAGYYATKDNNEMFQETLSVGDHDCIFFLPPGGSLELPGVMVEPPLKTGLVEGEYREVYTYANARLTIPAGWSGTIELPLILYTVSGSGSIGVNGEAYAIGSAVLSEMFQERKTFFYPLTIAAESELQLTYLVNPQLFNLSTVNTVVLEGPSSASDACKLRVEMIPLSLNSKIDGGRS